MKIQGQLIDHDLRLTDGLEPIEAVVRPLPEALANTKGEQPIHESLCRHTEYFPFPKRTHHGAWFRWIISKFELPSGNITDFAYVVTTSSENTIVLIEIEDPAKKMWAGAPEKAHRSADFTSAIEQVERWQTDLNRPEQMASLVATMKAMMGGNGLARNTWYVEYALVYGRSSENNSAARRDAYASLKRNSSIHFLTFDHLVTQVETHGLGEQHNIVKCGSPGPIFSYMYLNRELSNEFAYLEQGTLILDNDVERLLKRQDFEIDKWKDNQRLTVNGKYAAEKTSDIVKQYVASTVLNNSKA
ncbi:conserved hypothetical protein [Burkholderia cenocepacia]|uniref:Shedu anti-phage system protein SduA domain-containing protein n=1 Tax=Burkholderia cenocepacia TaxID=95486 RepID=UPI00192A83BF|nr:Shedu anti-phage system protein SduA domain-containing protein [Burkholderia cenocepacia]CAD9227669.1 conserved hypothetical protein [Burkholderia cenocepacia]